MIHNHDRFNAMSSRVASRLYASYSQMPDASTREAYLAMVTGSTPDVIKAPVASKVTPNGAYSLRSGVSTLVTACVALVASSTFTGILLAGMAVI